MIIVMHMYLLKRLYQLHYYWLYKQKKTTPINNAKNIDVVISMYNLIEYSDNFSKTSGYLWQFYRDESRLTNAGFIDNFPGNSTLFKFKQKLTGKAMANYTNGWH